MEEKAMARRVATLRAMPIFAELADKELTALAATMRLREYDRDETIFRQGDESREVYFLLKGKVRIFKISPAGDETSIAIFSTNDVIGELAAIDAAPAFGHRQSDLTGFVADNGARELHARPGQRATAGHGPGTAAGAEAALDGCLC